MEMHRECINCLICINHCPLLNNPQLSGFTYPHILANLDREPKRKTENPTIPTLCLTCRLCEIVCPRNIPITKALKTVRNTYNTSIKET